MGLLLVVIAVIAVAVFVGLGFARQDSFALSLDEVESEAGTWTQLPLSGNGGTVTSLAVDPNNPAVVYAGTENGVFKSTDAAQSWTQIMKSGLTLQSLEVSVFPDSTSTLFVTNSGFVTDSVLMRSTDGGASWDNLSWDGIEAGSWNMRTIRFFDLGSGPFMYVTDASAIDRDPDLNKDKAHIWCSVRQGRHLGRGHGADRQQIEAARDASEDYVEPVDPETGAKLLSFIPPVHDPGDASVVYAGTQGGVYKSVDGGATWARTSEGLAAPAVAGLVFDPVDPAVVYATTEEGISKSTDAGQDVEHGPQRRAGRPGLGRAISARRTLVTAHALRMDCRGPVPQRRWRYFVERPRGSGPAAR